MAWQLDCSSVEVLFTSAPPLSPSGCVSGWNILSHSGRSHCHVCHTGSTSQGHMSLNVTGNLQVCHMVTENN